MKILNLYSNDDVNLVEEEFSYFATVPLLNGFRFVGWTKDVTTAEEDKIPMGYESTDGDFYIPIFVNNFVNHTISDEEDREQEAIDKGKNACIFVHGSGNESYVKRYTTKEIKMIDFSFFDDNDVFEGFLYRS